jgi:NADH:ubiquinone oxidoreductase subunit E
VNSKKSILVCQHLTCRKQGAAKVLAAFRSNVSSDRISCEGCGCLGQCGNGPNVLILPEQVRYYYVSQADVPIIIDRLADCQDRNQ